MPDLPRKPNGTHGKVHDIASANAGWRYVGLGLYYHRGGDKVAGRTGDREVILVMVEGKARITGVWRFGRSKQRQNDCPPVVLALVLDEMGFPRSSEILPGDVGGAKTPEAALESLEEVHGCRDPNNRPTVVMDAGIATDDNLQLLKENGYGWNCISIEVRKGPPDRASDSTLRTMANHLVEAWRISDEDADELKFYAQQGAVPHRGFNPCAAAEQTGGRITNLR